MKGKLLVFSAPSGSGKTTIVRHLLAQPDLNLEFSISCTTREARGEEENGKDYYFISWEEFKKHIESQFESWMSWENYGNACETLQPNCSWDLDHIIPISTAKTEEEIYLLNHWSNFQPLCSKVNRWEKKDNIYPVYNLELNIEKQ